MNQPLTAPVDPIADGSADPTPSDSPCGALDAPGCRTPATLDAEALSTLAAGGTDPAPAPINPTAQAVRALQALAALLSSYGDLHEGEALLPYVREGWITGAGDSTARALIRAQMASEVAEFCVLDWRTSTDGRQVREVWGIFEGVRIQATQRGQAQVCTCGAAAGGAS